MAKKAKAASKPKQAVAGKAVGRAAAGSKAVAKKVAPEPWASSPSTDKHERKAKPSEAEAVIRRQVMAAKYLEQRDGMDEDTARMVVGGMEPDELDVLIVEATIATVGVGPGGFPQDEGHAEALTITPEQVSPNGNGNGTEPVEEEGEIIEFTENEVLAGSEEFPGLVLAAADAARRKNEAEKEYKAAKKKVLAIMMKAKAEKVMCMEHKLTVYKGHTVRLDEIKLIEAGCPADIVAKGWSDVPYDDVRIVAPK